VKIGLIVDGYSVYHSFPSGTLLNGIQDRLGDAGVLIVADSKHEAELEAKQLKKLARETDGVILYATELSEPVALQHFLKSGFPITAIDRIPMGIAIDSVVTNNRLATKQVTDRLIASGHTQIAYLSHWKRDFSSLTDRVDGYSDSMATIGVDTGLLVRWLPPDIRLEEFVFDQVVSDTIVSLMSAKTNVTAVVCAEDRVGCAVAAACEKLGIRVPEDLEIATFNDWHPMMLRFPWSMHRIVQRQHEIGFAAADLLLQRIASPGRPYVAEQIEAEIIFSETNVQKRLEVVSR